MFLVCCVAIRSSIAESADLVETPSIAEYCLTAQRVVTQTTQPVDVITHATFDGFVKSKAIIPEGDAAVPLIQQFIWTDDRGNIIGVSCKLKSADHLNLTYGATTAGPDLPCQTMNRAVYHSLSGQTEAPRFVTVIFDERETVSNQPMSGMTGPDWLRPYRAIYIGESGDLHIRSKGFRVDFTDPRFAKAPVRFRGVHYCHFIAPEHLLAVLNGDIEPETSIGGEVDTSGYGPPGAQ
jgi:hypothetical protein